MSALFEKLKKDALDWRMSGYGGTDFPLIGEILRWQFDGDPGPGEALDDGVPLKYLRQPQFQALEVYWFVRLCKNTPHVVDLYKDYYGGDKEGFFNALGVPVSRDALEYATEDQILDRVKTDLDFVKDKKIHALHEAAILDYPSYILALAMGAGKTVLIGAIIATEFAMSLRYPKGNFMKNALVFAPGTTIIESLRELSGMPFEKILPSKWHQNFAANLKIEYPRTKQKDIQALGGSLYNLIVTNTEKIQLRAKTVRRGKLDAINFAEKEKRVALESNLRLQKICGLPGLGIFSDEAHHTYGNTFDELKRVRETINHIHEQTPLVAVINTTGTPYYKKQSLKEVIFWYGLGDGIKDNILKSLNEGFRQYNMSEQSDGAVFDDVIREFFTTYGDVALPDGAKAKIAFYFKTQEHLDESRRLIERAMAKINQDASQILVNTQKSIAKDIEEFQRLNDPGNQKRVILLIGKGVEGWNCPSLFACALIKEQTRSNNYILQAATRCLRQVPGNTHSARIFLDADNIEILNKELENNFGTTLMLIGGTETATRTVTIKIRKVKLPKLDITRIIKRVVRAGKTRRKIKLDKPRGKELPPALASVLTPDFSGPRGILMPTGETKELPAGKETTGCHAAAWKIAAKYHLPGMPVLKCLRGLYPRGEIPNSDLYELFQQVEDQQADYKTVEEKVTDALALIRTHDEDGRALFDEENGARVHRLRMSQGTFDRMKQKDLFAGRKDYADKGDISFHYSPYNFDSEPEREFFRKVLAMLNITPGEVKEFLFTGGLTDPKKTDFHFEYLGRDGRYHDYFPDFVLVKKTGEYFIVEVKAERDRDDATVQAKAKAVEELREIQPKQFKYNIVYAPAHGVADIDLKPVTNWLYNSNSKT